MRPESSARTTPRAADPTMTKVSPTNHETRAMATPKNPNCCWLATMLRGSHTEAPSP
jgi:hypothetical protein